MKRILMLGGSMQQIPIIKKAKEMGLYVITCDYLPENPGHKFADEYYNVSTTDLEGVLELANKLAIDGIVAYASDPAAPTAAYVAERLALPGNPFESVKILTEKDLFRNFLQEHGFISPLARGYRSFEEAYADINYFTFPVMVKPVDSSGSKGVVKIYSKDELKAAAEEAFSYSKGKRIIIEEFIVKKGYQVSGDGFSCDGKLVFTSYGNELYSGKENMREYSALGEFWPSLLTNEQKRKVDDTLQELITALGMKSCAYNIEAILDENDNVYILELGPRNGGSYIPQLIQIATGVDLLEYTILAALGEDCSSLHMAETTCCVSNYKIMSHETGIFKRIVFDPEFEQKNLVCVYCTCKKGDEVKPYKNTSNSLGELIFMADSLEEMMNMTSDVEKFYHVEVE